MIYYDFKNFDGSDDVYKNKRKDSEGKENSETIQNFKK